MSSLLTFRDVSKLFLLGLFKKRRVWALKGLTFEVKRGEVFALVGESGSGKTTAGKIVLRLEEPTQGEVLLDGKPIHAYGKEYTRKVSMVFQDPRASLNPRLRVREIVEEPLVVHGIKDRKERVLRALRLAGLDESFLERKPESLSGGQRQRVAIARAIVLEPELIVADEPTASLDMSYRAGILELFKDLSKRGVSVLLITHDIRSVQRIANRVGVLYKGVLLEAGTKEEVLKNPLHPYTQYLLSSVPARHPSERKTYPLEEYEQEGEYACPFFARCEKRLPECAQRLREVVFDGRFLRCNLY